MSNMPLAYPIPPLNQGGTEKVFYDLSEELVKKGHDVYVFAPKGSKCSGKVIEYPSYVTEEMIGRFVYKNMPKKIDIINDFTFTSSVKRRKFSIPIISTHQCPLGSFTRRSVYPSKKMRNSIGKQKGYVIYNGINKNEYEFSSLKSDYLLFIGRIVREKGVLEAIEIANKTNQKLLIAGPIKDEQLFREEIEPKLVMNPNIEYIGAIGGIEKQALLKNARCVLFPIKWEEPFGLVLIEAMITGTPVLAFNRGSVPEVLSAFPELICTTVDEMIEKINAGIFPSSHNLRKYVLENFTRSIMAEKYLKVYRRTLKINRKKQGIKYKRYRRKKRTQ